MIIGQDLINRFILMHPYQPTYHVNDSLTITRTKMGLTFAGLFDVEEFSKWTLSSDESQQMKEILSPELPPQKTPKLKSIFKLRIYDYTEYFGKSTILNEYF